MKARESGSCLQSRKWKIGQFQFEHGVVMYNITGLNRDSNLIRNK